MRDYVTVTVTLLQKRKSAASEYFNNTTYVWFNYKIAWLTVWGVSSSITVFSEETATAAETWHHHYDNNDYDGSDQHTDNDANCIAEISNKSNKYLNAKEFKILN